MTDIELTLLQATPSQHPKHQIHVIITLVLLQTIGLFHECPQQRATSNVYHGMLVLVRFLFHGSPHLRKLTMGKMIRQNRLIERSVAWEHLQFPTANPAVLEETWHNWALYEALKRYLFNLPPNTGTCNRSPVADLQRGLPGILPRSSTSNSLFITTVVLAYGIHFVSTM